MRRPDYYSGGHFGPVWGPNAPVRGKVTSNYTNLHEIVAPRGNLCGLEPQLIKLEFIIYLPKLKVSMGALL